jgi:hypothetical protein
MIFTLLRFVVVAAVIYFVLTLIRNFVQGFTGPAAPPQKPAVPRNEPPQRTMEYHDVKDATFTEVSTDDSSSPKSS